MLWEDINGLIIQTGNLKSVFGYVGDDQPSFALDSAFIESKDSYFVDDEIL